MKHVARATVLILTLTAGQCDSNDSNQQQSQQQETILNQASNAVGMPAITNFQERRMLKEILELRDQALTTITYITDLQGHLHKVCDSIGYGIPYATQFTNPEYVTYRNGNQVTLPQADPNGLFSPASAEGTWVNCLDPKTQQASVVYIEPRVIVSRYPLSVP